MSDDPNKTDAEPRSVSDQEQEVRQLKTLMQKEFPDKSVADVEEAIGHAKRAISPGESPQRIEELVRQQFS